MKVAIGISFLLAAFICTAQGTFDRKTLIEKFGSSTCPLCVTMNKNLVKLEETHDGKFVLVKYPIDYPGTGDPYFQPEFRVLLESYGFSGTPYSVFDGGVQKISNANGLNGLKNATDLQIAEKSHFKINAEYTKSCDESIEVNIEVISDTMIDSAAYEVFAAIVEKETTNNKRTNGESSFVNQVKTVIDLGVLDQMLADSAQSIAAAYQFIGEYRLPAGGHEPIDPSIEHSVEEFDDLAVAIWIKNKSTGEFEQASWATQTNTHDLRLQINSLDGETFYSNFEDSLHLVSIEYDIVNKGVDTTIDEALLYVEFDGVEVFNEIISLGKVLYPNESIRKVQDIEFYEEIEKDIEFRVEVEPVVGKDNFECNNFSVGAFSLAFKNDGIEDVANTLIITQRNQELLIEGIPELDTDLVIKLYDMTGKLVQKNISNEGSQRRISTLNCEKGYYVLTMVSSKINVSKKIEIR